MESSEHINFIRGYLTALEQGVTGDALAAFFTPDVVQREFPNRLVPQGATRGLAEILEGAVRGQQVLQGQSYEILNAIGSGDQLAMEVQWIGKLAIPIGSLPVGGEMRARFGVFFEFRDGKIARQHNYDCFDPW